MRFLSRSPFSLAVLRALALFLTLLATMAASQNTARGESPRPAAARGERRHLVFWKGTDQELEVFRIYGRGPGPTAMILGGIQGDEPGGFLCAELYADLSLKTGNLIVVPRANFRSVILNERGAHGDMNRKFEDDAPREPEAGVVDILKSLMAESDLLLNLHEGSGFYRPVWESELANPRRYGQCIIADTDRYTRQADGRTLDLKTPAEEVIARLNREIGDPLHKFHFFNMQTPRADTRHIEQRKSATYYALTRLGIPAFGIETSKQLPSLEMKIRQHILAVNAFLDIFGIEPEQPGLALDKPVLGYVLVAVNDSPPIAAAAGQTLMLSPGDVMEVLHVSANYERGLSVEIRGLDGLNHINRPLRVEQPTAIVVRRDSLTIGEIAVALFPEGQRGSPPGLLGGKRAGPPRQAIAATLDMLPGSQRIARNLGSSPSGPEKAAGRVAAFRITVDGKAVDIPPDGQVEIRRGARVGLVDLTTVDGELPEGVVMNLKGFVPAGHENANTGEDRGHSADSARDMRPAFSEGGRGEVYAINAERGKTVLASCSLRITRPGQPMPASVTIRHQNGVRTLALGSRIAIPAGAKVELLDVSLPAGMPVAGLRLTLAGRRLPGGFPQTLTMREIAINLALFHGERLLGKVTWVPSAAVPRKH